MGIAWRKEMAIGREEIDDDHKTLINIINSVETDLEEGKRGRDLISNIQKLKKYTDEHFEKEESVLRKINYPSYSQHKNIHGDLIVQLNDISSGLLGLKGEKAQEKSIPKLVQVLRDWLLNHVLQDDMKIKHFLEGSK